MTKFTRRKSGERPFTQLQITLNGSSKDLAKVPRIWHATERVPRSGHRSNSARHGLHHGSPWNEGDDERCYWAARRHIYAYRLTTLFTYSWRCLLSKLYLILAESIQLIKLFCRPLKADTEDLARNRYIVMANGKCSKCKNDRLELRIYIIATRCK